MKETLKILQRIHMAGKRSEQYGFSSSQLSDYALHRLRHELDCHTAQNVARLEAAKAIQQYAAIRALQSVLSLSACLPKAH